MIKFTFTTLILMPGLSVTTFATAKSHETIKKSTDVTTKPVAIKQKPTQETKKIKFHKAETQAEKALDRILMINSGLNKKIRPSALIVKENDGVMPPLYSREFFTKHFIFTIIKEYININGEDCEEDTCTLGYDPIECSQDTTRIGFLYITTYESKTDATIMHLWEENEQDAIGDSFMIEKSLSIARLKKENGKWRLDGVCTGHVKINHFYCHIEFHTSFYPDTLS
jgi:hypothetical protein